ncbi:MAG TPA: hypothetical protein VJ276_13400 [Thermoanaerobaculia bacterium]|nr:hypothetical protein [Thermoanaerobaculia bacterium]
MRIIAALLLATAVALPSMTPEKWRADVDFFARELPKRHKNAFHAMTREQFDAAVAALKAKAATAGDDEMIVGLMQITAAIGDGHTNVRMPAGARRLPVSIVRYGDDYRITYAADPQLVGGKLTAIDEVPIAEVVTRLRTVIAQDESEWLVRGLTPSMMVHAEVLHGLGIAKDPRSVRLTVDGGKTVEVSTVLLATSPAAWPTAQTTQPAVRVDPQAALAFTWVEAAKTVYVGFRRYDDIKARSRELWQFVDAHPTEKIVFDLRQNGGGDYTDGRKYLVEPLRKRPKLKTYVLIGSRTFSAAMVNAIDFRRDAKATLVGQPIGERANSYQENDELVLPNSRLVVSYSTRWYEFLPGEKDPIVKPDQEIAPTWEDFVAGRDPALEWALGQ